MRPLLQLALDFFAPNSGVMVDHLTAEKSEPNRPLTQEDKALVDPRKIAKEHGTDLPPHRISPPQPTSAGWPGPLVFRHPQARRELRLGNALVGYALVRARRRTIGFTVGAEGLAVRAPNSVSLSAIDAALQEKSGWILRKLDETRERAGRQDAARIVWRDGAVLPFLGGSLCIRLMPGAPMKGCFVPGSSGSPPQLHLGLASTAKANQLRDATAAWLGHHARQHFAQRLDHFAPSMGVRWQRLALTNARTRWGSARSDGSIRLNWRLMHFAPDVIDYVVVHELAHLRFMDHSPQFWAVVEAELPDYRALRARLKAETSPVWRDD